MICKLCNCYRRGGVSQRGVGTFGDRNGSKPHLSCDQHGILEVVEARWLRICTFVFSLVGASAVFH